MFHCYWNSLPSVLGQPLIERAVLGWMGARGATWPGELWPGHFLLINTGILIIFLSRKLLLIRQSFPSGHHVINKQRAPFLEEPIIQTCLGQVIDRKLPF